MRKEKEVQKLLRKHLEKHGYTVKERPSEHGVDVTAFKDDKTYYVEVQGNTRRDGTPFSASQKYTHLLRAVGQVCLRMNKDPSGIYEIVLAEDRYYRGMISELQTALKKLDVTTYFVDSDGKVTN
jgi:hypothetical protein